jgi:hypothetical protein
MKIMERSSYLPRQIYQGFVMRYRIRFVRSAQRENIYGRFYQGAAFDRCRVGNERREELPGRMRRVIALSKRDLISKNRFSWC